MLQAMQSRESELLAATSDDDGPAGMNFVDIEASER